jgi:hypothetical protein
LGVAESETGGAKTREVVGIFRDAETFKRAVERLGAAGFGHADLSILASHSSIDAAFPQTTEEGLGERITDTLRPLVTDMRFAGPLVLAGFAVLFAGPIAAAIGALVAAGVGGLALKDLLGEVTSHPESADFVRAVEAGGIILWVWAETPEKEAEARAIMADCGAKNLHLHERGVS